MSNLIKQAVTMPQPQTMEDAFTMCKVLAKSDLVPRSYRGKPENIFLAYIAGQPFGWEVTMSMRSFHIIEGQPTLKPEIQVALVRQAGHSVTVKASSVEAVVLVGRRCDTGDVAEVSYTIDDAKRAGLVGKGNWKTYPEDMLFARAVSRLNRRLFQDVLLGCAYVPEELGAVVNGDGDVVDVTPVSNLVAAGATVELAAAVDVPGVKSKSGESVDEIVDRVEAGERVSLLDPSLIDEVTDNQVKRIHILKNELELTDEQYRAGLEKVAGVTSSKQLSKASAADVISALERAVERRKPAVPDYWNPETVEEVQS